MANWDHPTLNSNYTSLLSELKNRDLDVARMFRDAPASPVAGMVRLQRNPIKFQQRGSSDWADLVLSIEGGGTGETTLLDFRDSLAFGTMSTQNSDAVAITGGTIKNVTGIGVKNGSITTIKLDDDAVTDDKLATNGLNIERFTIGTIGENRLPSISFDKLPFSFLTLSQYNALENKSDDILYLITTQ